MRPYARLVTDEPDDEGSKGKAASAVDEADAKAATKAARKPDKDDDEDKDKDKDRDDDDDDVDKVPPTRKQALVDEDEKAPAEAASAFDPHAVLTYPDDSTISGTARKIDNYVGMAEQIVLVSILAFVVLTAATHAITDRFFQYHVPFKEDVIRAGTFAIAMLAGAFASHQMKHLSMDLISRRLSPRARLFLKVFLGLFVIFIVALLIRSGFHNIENEKQFAAEDKLITRVRIAWLIPIGGFMIIFHTVLHAIIDVDYIVRRKTPPERMRSAH